MARLVYRTCDAIYNSMYTTYSEFHNNRVLEAADFLSDGGKLSYYITKYVQKNNLNESEFLAMLSTDQDSIDANKAEIFQLFERASEEVDVALQDGNMFTVTPEELGLASLYDYVVSMTRKALSIVATQMLNRIESGSEK
jgi:hypothetical protein